VKRKEIKEMLELLLQAGAPMSNICFNGKQNEALPDEYRESMRVSLEGWELSKNTVRQWMKEQGMK
jgi:hypothetical protein